MSAKLNYLEEKNQALHENVSDLQKWVQDSFRSVSNGKTLIAGAITDKEGTAQPDYRFEQFAQSIRHLRLVVNTYATAVCRHNTKYHC